MRSPNPALAAAAAPRLGLRENWAQFSVLVLVNAFVGAMVGVERAILPLLAESEFGLASRTAILSFIASFGVVKALSNLFAGRLSDRIGRKGVLIAGWLVGLPVPLIIMFAPSWGWIIFANVLLGVNQGLCWSTTVIMKIDLVGPARRGLAMGLNEAAGYVTVALAALGAGYLAATYALRPQPFVLGLLFAVAGLLISLFFVRESREHATLEAQQHQGGATAAEQPSFAQILLLTSWKDRALFATSQAGMVNNLNDGMAWGLFPLYFALSGLSIGEVSVLAAIYPAVQGLGQLGTGALSDHLGRKWLIASGMVVQAGGIFLIMLTGGFWPWAGGAALLGLGTAMVYPTLLAVVGDVAHPSWRASAVGVYRLWRDGGYAVGAMLAGVLADALGLSWAIGAVGGLTLLSGIIVALVMYETLPAAAPEREEAVSDETPPREPPILADKHYAAPPVFDIANLRRGARRQKRLPPGDVPPVCVLDPDGDLVDYLRASGQARPHPAWACYHTTLDVFMLDGVELGIIGRAVGASFAVLIAEELFVSGCQLLISVTSAGQITPLGPTPYFVLLERALRDEGTSYHYLPPNRYSALDAGLRERLSAAWDYERVPRYAGSSWTTDAPFRETAEAIAAARAEGIAAVEMEASALYALAAAKGYPIFCFAHVTNTMATAGDDFEKGPDQGSRATLAIIAETARIWRTAGQQP